MRTSFFFLLASSLTPQADAASVSLGTLSVGDIVISEIMSTPRQSSSPEGQWIELHNPTASSIDLHGLVVQVNDASFSIDSAVVVPAGGFAVLAGSADSSLNGGLSHVDYTYNAGVASLAGRKSTVRLLSGDVEVDAVAYVRAQGFSPAWGVAMNLSPGHLDAASNDMFYRWCPATTAFGAGDLGSPGQPNAACPAALVDLAHGDLVFTELMIDPESVVDRYGEWMEFTNTTDTDINLRGLEVTANDDWIDINADLLIAPGEHVVIGRSSTRANNGGIDDIRYAYGDTLSLTETAGSVSLGYAGVLFDTVAWDSATFPVVSGASLNLDIHATDATLNDDANSWCLSASWYHDVNTGTPGFANDECLLDADGDGVNFMEDCDDNDPNVHPYAVEVCDGVDNDCDADIDEEVMLTWYADADGDGHGESGAAAFSCSQPTGHAALSGDCDDTDAAVSPSAAEICDGIDNNCDAQIDEGVVPTHYADIDGDGYGDADTAVADCIAPDGWVSNGDDCDDSSAISNPGAEEICDNLDNDCDDRTDEGFNLAWYVDADEDGYGDPNTLVTACTAPEGSYSRSRRDCDDSSDAVYPEAEEICDEQDNDCDGNIDEGAAITWYADADQDGFGTAGDTTKACSQPTGYTDNTDDCDDSNATVGDGSAEICDGIDNDCDGNIDEGVTITAFVDADGDGYGDAFSSVDVCAVGVGQSDNSGDCNDSDNAIHPGVTDTCDDIDNDCDGTVDENATFTTFYTDNDGDGYGDAANAFETCDNTADGVTNGNDPDDSSADITPEICDGIDNDGDGVIDNGFETLTWFVDGDGDGYGDANMTVEACSQPVGTVANSDDCNDSDTLVSPDAQEVCDGIDNNCDAQTDEGLLEYFYADVDADGYGDPADFIMACELIDGYVTDDTDCDDTFSSINPGMEEVCDDLDNNCDDQIDEGTLTRWYADLDRDTFGDAGFYAESCEAVSIFDTDSDEDCNDRDATIFPGAEEVCDTADNNCDGTIDEGLTSTWFEDDDGDGYGDSSDPVEACSQPDGFVATGDDCDDRDTAIHPEALEVCDHIDNNCDTQIDEGVTATWFADADGDGYGNSDTAVDACEAPDGYVSNGDDCNDCDDGAWEDGTEACVVAEECDCDENTDEEDDTDGDGDGQTFYADEDGDGYGDATDWIESDEAVDGFVDNPSDPDDNDATITPEVCDGIDNDGDGETDEALLSLRFDDETFSSNILILSGNAQQDETGELLELTAATNNQRGSAMVAFPMPTDAWRVSFEMFMGNGTGADGLGLVMITPDAANLLGAHGGGLGVLGLEGYSVEFDTYQNSNWGDPDENHVGLIDNTDFHHLAINSDIPELEDSGWMNVEIISEDGRLLVLLDDEEVLETALPSDLPAEVMLGLSAATGALNNDHLIDNLTIGCPVVEAEPCETQVFYMDADGDGYGDPAAEIVSCEQPVDAVTNADDCNDEDPYIFAEGTFYGDVDADGYGNPADAILSCGAPDGYVSDDTDCDDTLSSVNPGTEEVCDALDNNCDDQIDEGTLTTVWMDADQDGHGDPMLDVEVCAFSEEYAAQGDDCEDADPTVHPSATETCDDIDNNCDGQIDEGLTTTFYADEDIDSYGDAESFIVACEAPEGYTVDAGDCDDDNSDAFPGAPELCNNLDDDCDGMIDNDMPDTDGSGVADCREVAVVMTDRAVVQGEKYTCDGRSALDRELDEMEDAINEMGLEMVVLYEDDRQGIEAGELEPYSVIILHNLGWAKEGSVITAQSIAQMAEQGKGLIMMGDDAAYLAHRYARSSHDESLKNVMSLADYRHNGFRGRGAERADVAHAVIDGMWGEVAPFSYVADIDQATTAGAQEQHLMYIEGTDYPAVWATDGLVQRTVTMSVGLYASHDCPLSDEDGLQNIRSLFQNAVWWAGRY